MGPFRPFTLCFSETMYNIVLQFLKCAIEIHTHLYDTQVCMVHTCSVRILAFHFSGLISSIVGSPVEMY